jgi:RNA polymerase sigma-B factor
VTGGEAARADADELEEVFVRYVETRDPALRDELVRAYLPLADYLAKRFLHRGVAADDLFQVASLGLVKAVDRFEPHRGVMFSTFATPTIVGELKRHFRDKGWALRVPRRLQELHLELVTTVGLLTQELGRSPTVAEIAAKSGIGEDEVLEATDVAQVYRVGSLGTPPSEGGEPADASSRALSALDGNLELVEERIEIGRLLQVLAPRERQIVHLRFYEGRTQSEIARRLGISQMHVSRLLARSIEALRQAAKGPPAKGRPRPTGSPSRRRRSVGQGRTESKGSTVVRAMDFSVQVEEKGDVAVVAVAGELDISTSPELRDRLVELGGGQATRLVIDLEGVEFLDSTGLGVLVGALKRMRSKEGELVLVCTNPRILKVFEITALTEVFTIVGSLDEAFPAG